MFFLLVLAVVRHEEIPAECVEGVARCLPGQATSRTTVPQCCRLCQVGTGSDRLPSLGPHRQRGRHGHAQGQAATR